MFKRFCVLFLTVLTTLVGVWGSSRIFVLVAAADEPPRPIDSPKKDGEARPQGAAGVWTTAVKPKDLSSHVTKGLAWLVENQHPNGGWSQGEESAQMGGDKRFRDTSDVADTCIAALALLRAGNTPQHGPYKDSVAKAVRYVRQQVEASDNESLAVSDVKGTRVQMKLGPNIDTFLASLFLAEVKGQMQDQAGNQDVDVALNKVLSKIKKHQKADGTWDNRTGWAPILAQSVGGKGLNRAAQAGASVPAEVLARTENFAVAATERAATAVTVASAPARERGVDIRSLERATSGPATGRMMAGMAGGLVTDGAAGVELYARASNLSVLQDSVNTYGFQETKLREKLDTAKTDEDRKSAQEGLTRIERGRKAHQESQKALLGRLDDAAFVAGFGSNGGEEYLSYMNISESLVLKGGLDWKRWDDAMASNLNRVQNDDGSWSGHHCITGRTFCTSSALLVLMADRTPVPVAGKADQHVGQLAR